MEKIILTEEFRKYLTKISSQASQEAEWHPIDRAFIEQHYPEIFSIDTTLFVYANFEITSSNLWATSLFLCVPEIWMKLEVDDIEMMLESFNNLFAFFSLIEFTCKYIGVDILPMIFTSSNLQANFKTRVVKYLRYQWHALLMAEDTRDSLENDMEGIYLKYDPLQWQQIRQKFLKDSRVQQVKTNFTDFKKYLATLIGEPVIG